ncbi:predicted protein [Phaeodactylum tricornutum CCAP 1055/1]|jgi:hypothetical protein|uniref:3-oxo-5-alpha-steroid 4-dehydrogenase C-terminal domain-containing protein n=1 Tax=Phaeodactylum tricornutum (strain CCAP 1055/1) TaxID=556484 RepID=B7G1M2_PHATC|nr:predicted protein [Phaeodactylum tricornutum CCAP 1055/1]EEC47706.1 predicted protein [Phaeodactylum tricornutum CCAP 1055/1]|eukprot:XP_002181054.1 predicted protein [Phaeodactylum tricornutum CCAP 1055/1]
MSISAFQLPAMGPIAAPPGLWGAGIAAFQGLVISSSFSTEIKSPTLYSKFAAGKKLDNPISSQNGMFRIYVPSAIVATLGALATYGTKNFRFALPLLALHFWKRSAEVAFVHNYSGTMPAASANTISTYYTLTTILVGATALPLKDVLDGFKTAAVTLFSVGTLGNAYHHLLLAKLRSSKDPNNDNRQYIPPKGGLFSLVAAPHYMFELVAWLGIACAAQQANAFLTFASMCSYLAGRAYKTNEIYCNQFNEDEWPRSRKNMLPWLF